MTGGLSAVIAHVTLLSVRGSGRPFGPVGFGTTNFATAGLPAPPEPDPTAVVVLAQPAATPATPTAAPAPRAPRTRLRRVSRCS